MDMRVMLVQVHDHIGYLAPFVRSRQCQQSAYVAAVKILWPAVIVSWPLCRLVDHSSGYQPTHAVRDDVDLSDCSPGSSLERQYRTFLKLAVRLG